MTARKSEPEVVRLTWNLCGKFEQGVSQVSMEVLGPRPRRRKERHLSQKTKDLLVERGFAVFAHFVVVVVAALLAAAETGRDGHPTLGMSRPVHGSWFFNMNSCAGIALLLAIV